MVAFLAHPARCQALAALDGCASLHNIPHETAYCPHSTDGHSEAGGEQVASPSQLLGARRDLPLIGAGLT